MKILIKAAQCAGVLGILLHSFAMPVYAAEQQRPPRDEHHFGPPHEALLACKGLTENDVCSFAGRNDELVNGVCSTPPHQTDEITLACKPDNMPEPHNGEPPEDRQD
ncbi:hypothetical protein [Cellvibrio sp.]|jgi:hypothetical protein